MEIAAAAVTNAAHRWISWMLTAEKLAQAAKAELSSLSSEALVAASGKMLVDVNSEAAEFSTTAYAKANAVAYEVLGNLRTILSVNGTSRMAKRYFDQTEAAEAMGISRSFKVGVANGGMMGGFLVMYCIMTVFGAWLLFSQVDEFGCDPSGAAEPRIKCDKYTYH